MGLLAWWRHHLQNEANRRVIAALPTEAQKRKRALAADPTVANPHAWGPSVNLGAPERTPERLRKWVAMWEKQQKKQWTILRANLITQTMAEIAQLEQARADATSQQGTAHE